MDDAVNSDGSDSNLWKLAAIPGSSWKWAFASIRAAAAVVRGDTVDISESGISAMLREEVPVGEVVRLEFALPLGEVEVLALVRQRSAFRYGFQFVEASSAQDVIGRTCSHLAVEQSVRIPRSEHPIVELPLRFRPRIPARWNFSKIL